jgi:hypothetical protein
MQARKQRTWKGVLAGAGAALLAMAPTAFASVHFMVIQEVFTGTPDQAWQPGLTADQRAQFVMLRMTAQGQRFTNGTWLRVEDADGNLLGRFGTFTSDVTKGGAIGCSYPTCPPILIGTQAAKNLFTFAFDQIVDGQTNGGSPRVALPVPGGRVCFVDSAGTSVFDCVAWGNFDCTRSGNCSGPNTGRTGDLSGNGCDMDFGTPAAAATGLRFGKGLTRGSFVCGAKENSTQFSLTFPHPVNNNGANDNVDGDTDGLIDQLDCADANPMVWWPPIEVRGFMGMMGPSKSMDMSWPSQSDTAGPSVAYDLIRGSLANPSGTAFCLGSNQTSTSISDASLLPPGGYYFMVRADSGSGCIGTYGTSSRDTFAATTCP